jgi:hypothetical protein
MVPVFKYPVFGWSLSSLIQAFWLFSFKLVKFDNLVGKDKRPFMLAGIKLKLQAQISNSL